jgi:CheY-like chemotaxis protein
MDVQMPGMDGLEATRALRRLPAWRQRPILALTANAFGDDRLACEGAGMDGFIAKPMDVDTLYGTLLRWLDRSRALGPPTPELATAPTAPPAAPPDSPAPESSAPDSDTLARLAALPGHNLANGLQLLGGRERPYLQLLHRFLEHHGSNPDRLDQLLQAGELEAVCALAHDLRGTAANLGAEAIVQPCAQLEQLLWADASQHLAKPGAGVAAAQQAGEHVRAIRGALARLQAALMGSGHGVSA